MPSFGRNVRVPTLLAACALAVALVPDGARPHRSPAYRAGADGEPRRPFLFKDSRAELALARARRDTTVTLVIASRRGSNPAVARRAEALGGSVRFRDDDVDYLRVRVPTERIEEFIESAPIQAVDVGLPSVSVGRVIYNTAGRRVTPVGPEVGPEAGAPRPEPAVPDTPRTASSANAPSYSIEGSYTPLEDIGATTLLAEHPTFDGRGVTVALIDGNVDFLLPELQTATTLDGEPTRKIVGYANTMDPREEGEAWPQWVEMAVEVEVAGGRFAHEGDAYRAPRDGRYRFGFLDESEFSSPYLEQDLNRDGNPEASSRLFGILWDRQSNTVWVDTDQDRDFTDERGLEDYAANFDTGAFGVDDASTPLREAIGFAVQTDPEHGFVAINVGYYQHGTMVAGALTANADGAAGGRVNGVAPGARLVSIWAGSSTYGLIEGMIRAFEDPRVDIVLLEQNVYVAGPYLLRDGRFTASIICGRLIERYRKPFFVPGGNTAGLGLTSEHGVSAAALGIGAYQSKSNYFLNYGITPAEEDKLHFVGSYGPAGNGALQPDVISPTSVVTTYPAFTHDIAVRGVWRLPAGYGMCGGTSCATPVSAGATALLISAAKQAGIRYDPERIRHALTSTARFLPNTPTHRQGNGLIQVGAAWQVLEALHETGPPPRIEVRAPVRTVHSRWLETPHEGVGLYEREGWRAGDRGERMIVFTRVSGPGHAMEFDVSWIGNDGTFRSARTVRLPLNRPVRFPVAVAPRSAGVHSALLSLDHADVPGHARRVMATVVAAERFTRDNGYVVEREAEVERPGKQSYFFRVPPDASVLKVKVETEGQIRLDLHGPDGRSLRYLAGLELGTQTRIVQNPLPGVWEALLWNTHDAFEFEPGLPTPLEPTSVTVTASVLRVDATPAVLPIRAAEAGTSAEIEFTNRLAGFRGGALSAPFGAARELHPTIRDRRQRVHTVTVPEGSTRLLARVSARDTASDLDLYVFDCTGERCTAAATSVGPGASERVSIRDPGAGSWKVVVDAAGLAVARTEYDYVDVIVNPRFGTIAVADAPLARDAGATWRAPVDAWLARSPGDGRVPYGVLTVLGEDLRAAAVSHAADDRVVREPAVLGSAIVRFGLETRADGQSR